jgi:hypothetical protein
VALGSGCSSDSDGARRGEDGAPSTADPDGDGQPGDGDGDGDGLPGIPGDFDECAEARFDADTGRRAGNIVWVIDTSGSMEEEATQVQDNMNAFVTSIVAAGLADYRVVVISEQDYVTVADPLGSDDVHFRFIEEEVSSNEPLEDLLARLPDYKEFLLPDAVTHFVVVTDDESDISAEDFIGSMGEELGSEFRVHAIASPPGEMPPPGDDDDDDDDDDDSGCVGPNGDAAAPGVQHYRAAELTEGLTFSICTEDWSALFGELAKAVIDSAPLPCELEIPAPGAGQTLDPDLVNVLYTAPDAAQVAIPRASAEAQCTGTSAWYYDDAESPTRIILCPEACTAAQQGGALELAFGCEGVLL